MSINIKFTYCTYDKWLCYNTTTSSILGTTVYINMLVKVEEQFIVVNLTLFKEKKSFVNYLLTIYNVVSHRLSHLFCHRNTFLTAITFVYYCNIIVSRSYKNLFYSCFFFVFFFCCYSFIKSLYLQLSIYFFSTRPARM